MAGIDTDVYQQIRQNEEKHKDDGHQAQIDNIDLGDGVTRKEGWEW